MYYFLIFVATLLIGIQFSLSKLYQKNIKQCFITLILFSVIMAFIASIFFLIICKFEIHLSLFSLMMAGLYAIVTISNNILSIKIMSIGRISIFTVFMMLGPMFLPFIYGLIFLKEVLTIGKTVGIIIMVIALFLPMVEKKNEYIINKLLFYILCFAVFLSNGADGIITKAHQINNMAVNTYEFLTISYIINFILSFIIFFIVFFKSKDKTAFRNNVNQIIQIKNLLIIIIYSLIIGICGILLFKSAVYLPASVMFPIITGGTIIITSIFGWLFFKEKLTKYILAELILSFIASVCFIF